MPRDGTNLYYLPVENVVAGNVIASTPHNTFMHDIETDLNTVRPIKYGGTGAANPDAALASLGAEKSNQVVTNYDAQAWVSGSLSSAVGATGAPPSGGTATSAFTGTAYVNAASIALEARDATTGKVYYRSKPTAGAWSAWALDGGVSFQPVDPQLFAGIPVNNQTGPYTLLATDAQKCIVMAGAIGVTVTIPSNASVPFPIGTCVTVHNQSAGNGSMLIAITSDTMYASVGGPVTGTRTLQNFGLATVLKFAANKWIISGNGLS